MQVQVSLEKSTLDSRGPASSDVSLEDRNGQTQERRPREDSNSERSEVATKPRSVSHASSHRKREEWADQIRPWSLQAEPTLLSL